MHPAGGNVVCYAALAREFPPEQPLYGIQASGLHGEEDAIDNLDAMASRYVDAITSVQDSGPYLLGGWSAGGNIAYEIAQQLTRRGEIVAFLGLIDASASLFGREMPGHADVLLSIAEEGGVVLDQEHVRSLPPDDQLQYYVDTAKAQGMLADTFDTSYAIRLRNVYWATLHALGCHEASRYTGNANLFACSEVPPDKAPSDLYLGWQGLVEGELHVRAVPGSHQSVVKPPHVAALAGQLLKAIDEALSHSINEFVLKEQR
ncbi:MAG: hypothetical protein LBP58_11125 [Azoarcus sp.]|nr:hypothetical protein [Azoarcus sp.]